MSTLAGLVEFEEGLGGEELSSSPSQDTEASEEIRALGARCQGSDQVTHFVNCITL